MAFCLGAIIDGNVHPFVVGTGAINSPLCQSIIVSIANPRVYHNALHSGSDSTREFGLHIFPKSVLRLSETNPAGKLFAPLSLPSPSTPGTAGAPPSLSKNLTIRLGVRRASVYDASHAAKTSPFIAAAKDPARESHARDFIAKPVHPKILDEEFPEYQTLLDAM
jgi:hypothetical protein